MPNLAYTPLGKFSIWIHQPWNKITSHNLSRPIEKLLKTLHSPPRPPIWGEFSKCLDRFPPMWGARGASARRNFLIRQMLIQDWDEQILRSPYTAMESFIKMRQIEALPNGIQKLSVPLGAINSTIVVVVAIDRHRSHHCQGKAFKKTINNKGSKLPIKTDAVPSKDLRLISPTPQTFSFCLPQIVPTISPKASPIVMGRKIREGKNNRYLGSAKSWMAKSSSSTNGNKLRKENWAMKIFFLPYTPSRIRLVAP